MATRVQTADQVLLVVPVDRDMADMVLAVLRDAALFQNGQAVTMAMDAVIEADPVATANGMAWAARRGRLAENLLAIRAALLEQVAE